MFVGVALDGILQAVSFRLKYCRIEFCLTAIGFASVLTNSEVIFRVRDMLSYAKVLQQCYEGQLVSWRVFIAVKSQARTLQC